MGVGGKCGGLTRLIVDRDFVGVTIPCQSILPGSVSFYPNGALTSKLQPNHIWYRRVDLDGIGPERRYSAGETLLPGRYQIQLRPPADDLWMSSLADGQREREMQDGWFGTEAGNFLHWLITVRGGAPSLSGAVTQEKAAVPGAPVYIGKYDAQGNNRQQLWQLRADANGQYRLAGLTPGAYRVLSSFDFDTEDRYAMEKAPLLVLKEGDKTVHDLTINP